MRSIAATMLAGAAMIWAFPPAWAYSNIDAYTDCWAAVATGYLDKNGATTESLKRAVEAADQICEPHKKAAFKTALGADIDEMRRYMEVQLYNANGAAESAPAQAAPIEREHNPSIVYARKPSTACAWLDDLKKHRNYMQADRPDLAVQLDCLPIQRGQKLIVLDGIGDDLLQIHYEARGFKREFWIARWDVEH